MSTAAIDGKAVSKAYTEAYAVMCPSDENRITGSAFVNLTAKSDVAKHVLKKIWDSVDTSKKGVIDKTHFFLALAYVALAQLGKEPCDRELMLYSELPEPKLGSLATLQASVKRQSNVQLSFTFRELEEAEFIQVSISAKKGGMIKKHTNYEIFSRRRNCTNTRRYSDFEPLDALLRKKYPYRIIPALPVKSLLGKGELFVENRRKGLQRYLMFLGRHPVLRDDPIFIFFLSESGPDFQSRIKAQFRSSLEEWKTSPVAGNSLDYVPEDILGRVHGMQQEITPLLTAFQKLLGLAERTTERRSQMSDDWRAFGDCLKDMTKISSGYLAGQDRWISSQTTLKDLGNHMATVSDRYVEQCTREADGMVSNMHQFVDLLVSFKDLLDRRHKGIGADFAKTGRKLDQDRRRLDIMQAAGSETADKQAKLNGKIQRRDSFLGSLEQQHEFSLYCVWMEGKLVNANFAQIGHMMEEMVSSQALGHAQMANAWDAMKPLSIRLVEVTESKAF